MFLSLSLGYAPPPTTPQPLMQFCTNISQFKVNCTSEASCIAAVPNPIPPYANFTDPYFLCLDNTGPPGHELRYARHDMHLPNIATHTTMELFDSKPRRSPATSRRPAMPRLSACNWRGSVG